MPILSKRTQILLKLFMPQRKRPNPECALSASDKNLQGKTIVFTGGTDGIGRLAAELLYKMGANLIILGRNERKGKAVLAELEKSRSIGHGQAAFELCDLASMDSVKACAKRIKENYPRIDVLVNNAGINMTQPIFTDDGFETNWAVNYLGPRLLTELLLDRIRDSAPARIINLTTNTDFIEKMDLDEIEAHPNFDTTDTYTASKLAMNMYTIELARQLEGSAVTVNYLYPGYIKSNLLSNLKGAEKMMQYMMNIMASPTLVGADRIVRLVASSKFEGVSGVYLAQDELKPHHEEAQIPEKRARMQAISQKVLSKWIP